MRRALAILVHVVLGLFFWVPVVGVVAGFTTREWLTTENDLQSDWQLATPQTN